MQRLNELVSQKRTTSREFANLLTAGHMVVIGEERVLVMSLHDEVLFGLSKQTGGPMSYSVHDIEFVESYSEEAAKLYEKLWNLC